MDSFACSEPLKGTSLSAATAGPAADLGFRRLSCRFGVRRGSWCGEYDLVVRFAALEQPVRLGGLLQGQFAPVLHS